MPPFACLKERDGSIKRSVGREERINNVCNNVTQLIKSGGDISCFWFLQRKRPPDQKVSGGVGACDMEPLRLIKQCCPWEEGRPAWIYLLILHSSQPTGLCVCTRLKCALIWRGGSHLGLMDGWIVRFISSQKNK